MYTRGTIPSAALTATTLAVTGFQAMALVLAALALVLGGVLLLRVRTVAVARAELVEVGRPGRREQESAQNAHLRKGRR